MRASLKLIAATLAAISLAACVSIPEINRANYALDAAWQKDVNAILEEDGTRYYAVSKSDAFAAMNATLQTLGLIISRRDEQAGMIIASAIAPRPLNAAEWKQVDTVELPRMKEIIAREIGPVSASMFILAPEHYRLAFVAAVDGSNRSAKVGMNARLERISPPNGTYWPQFPPPTAARVGIAKVWAEFESELSRRRLPSKKIEGLEPVRQERQS